MSASPALKDTTKAPRRRPSTTLVSRNVVVGKHRTSIRLEPEMWVALKDVCRRERATLHDICSLVATEKPTGTSLTAAIRVFIMAYFRSAATEDGHSKSGHGRGIILSGASLTNGTMISPMMVSDQPPASYMIGSRLAPPPQQMARHY